jgi:hypothetical protein
MEPRVIHYCQFQCLCPVFRINWFKYFFQQHWESEYFFRKKTITPPPFQLNGRTLINFRMHRSDDCRSWNIITNVNRWAHVSFWFWHFISCWFFIFFSDNSKCFRRNGFEMYILIIIYTVCTCDTLVPTRILNSEISWFCFDFPKWGPVSFIITDFMYHSGFERS